MRFVKKKGNEKLLLNQVEEPKTSREWEQIADNIVDRVFEAIDYFCWNIETDVDVVECFSDYTNYSLKDAVSEFYIPPTETKYFGVPVERLGKLPSFIRERDVELLQRMPKTVLERAERKFHKLLEEEINRLKKEEELEI